MYLLEEFVENARKKVGKPWPSDDHKTVAHNVCLGNPQIRTMDSLIEVVRRIIETPQDKIRLVTTEQILGTASEPDS